MPELTNRDALELQQHVIDEYHSDALTWGDVNGRRALLRAPIDAQLYSDQSAGGAGPALQVTMLDPRFAGFDGFEEFSPLKLSFRHMAASPDRVATANVEMWDWLYEAARYLQRRAAAGGEPA